MVLYHLEECDVQAGLTYLCSVIGDIAIHNARCGMGPAWSQSVSTCAMMQTINYVSAGLEPTIQLMGVH
jgi:hypothetical protein